MTKFKAACCLLPLVSAVSAFYSTLPVFFIDDAEFEMLNTILQPWEHFPSRSADNTVKALGRWQFATELQGMASSGAACDTCLLHETNPFCKYNTGTRDVVSPRSCLPGAGFCLLSTQDFMILNLAREILKSIKQLSSHQTFSVMLPFAPRPTPKFCFFGKMPRKIFQVILLKDKEEVK